MGVPPRGFPVGRDALQVGWPPLDKDFAPAMSETSQAQEEAGRHAAERSHAVRRAFTMFGYAVASLADIGLLVAGSALMALAAAVLLDGFNIVRLGLTTSTGAMLGSALVIAVFGGFSLGVAFEGPIGHGTLSSVFEAVQLAIARAIAAIGVGLAIALLGGFLTRYTDELPYPFELAADVVELSGRAGLLFVPLLAVPVTFLLRWRFPGERWMEEIELPIMYLVWLAGAMFLVLGVL